ncbi:MAG: hypothetical protein HC903_08325 [Methylacidiphilales bacterium]|nr:hypothetical protein [Candidatus Methylacidiphilales bacterium]NJR15723.1 hypothetical protein [Calothrix sp. CSU_2_0]
MQLSFSEIFGNSSSQSLEELRINLAEIGLPNSAQGILASLIWRCVRNGEITANGEVITANGEFLEFNNAPIADYLAITYLRNEIKFRNSNQYLSSIYRLIYLELQ